MLKYLFFLILLSPLFLLAEQLSKDSLQNRLSQVEDLEQVRTLRALSEAIENEGYEAAMQVAQEAVDLAKKLGDERELGLSLNNKGILQDMFGRFKDATQSFIQAQDLLEIAGEVSEQANNIYYLGMAHHHLDKKDSAMVYCQKALAMFQSVNDSAGLSETLNGIGIIHQSLNEFEESLQVFFEALDYAKNSKQSHILGNIGISFLQIKEFDQALSYFRQCYEQEMAQQNMVDLGYTLNYLGSAHFYMQQYDSAAYYFRIAYENNLALNQLEQIQNSLGNLIRTLERLGQKQEAFDTIKLLEDLDYHEQDFSELKASIKFDAFIMLGQMDSANFYIQQSIDSALAKKIWTTAYANTSILARNYFEAKEWEKGLDAMTLHYQVKDSIFFRERTEIIQQLSIEYETEKKEAEIQRLQVAEANARFRIRAWIIGFILLLGLGIAFIWFQSVNNRKNREIKLERLRTEIASDLHDEMGSILTGISMQAQMMKYGSAEGAQVYQDKIISNSQKAIAAMRDVIWSIDSRYDQVGGLVDRMKEHAFEMLNPLDIQWDFQINSSNLDEAISPDVRQHLYLIFKEAINNIVKHAPENQVKISLYQQKENWSLNIHNWSEDLDLKPHTANNLVQSLGQGLKNMESRARKIGAEFQLIREAGFQLILHGKTFPA